MGQTQPCASSGGPNPETSRSNSDTIADVTLRRKLGPRPGGTYLSPIPPIEKWGRRGNYLKEVGPYRVERWRQLKNWSIIDLATLSINLCPTRATVPPA